MYNVLLLKFVGTSGRDGGWYVKRHFLPLAPFVGLGVIGDKEGPPDPIDEVFVNEDGI